MIGTTIYFNTVAYADDVAVPESDVNTDIIAKRLGTALRLICIWDKTA